MFAEKYAAVYDLFNEKKPYKKEIDFVYKWAGKPKSIIDIGCGTASYWKYYPKNTDMLGIDSSPEMISKSKYSDRIICADATNYQVINYADMVMSRYDCATALFDVINYIPKHNWWKNIYLKKGGYFIFDILSKEKADKEGFSKSKKVIGNLTREIVPQSYDGKVVKLDLHVSNKVILSMEQHKMFMYSKKDIEKFCGKEFEIVDVKETKNWQTWYKCVKK